ncbi:hypothetical protein [Parasporobacterium paucivorans]|uniref:Uncharacterized protein n=1 Tax=Parasporobacterium paucivorans DSM 15970 TaxID=1122934 RepID=A0A1M6GLP9_9FIRM|nr:hypothetical protein [Parasporobacterium paucivorans]SHJ10858.1 hypothetical protein SAMN02745691_01359 [Parasporobacterium paucivorans DSM 15970]
MKTIIKEILFGILIFIIIMILEFLVTLPFGEAGVENMSHEQLRPHLNREFLLTALPAGIVTFLFAWLLKTDTRASAVRRSCVWIVIALVLYLLMGIGNSNLDVLFTNFGMYVLLICIFLGPLVFAAIKRLK